MLFSSQFKPAWHEALILLCQRGKDSVVHPALSCSEELFPCPSSLPQKPRLRLSFDPARSVWKISFFPPFASATPGKQYLGIRTGRGEVAWNSSQLTALYSGVILLLGKNNSSNTCWRSLKAQAPCAEGPFCSYRAGCGLVAVPGLSIGGIRGKRPAGPCQIEVLLSDLENPMAFREAP